MQNIKLIKWLLTFIKPFKFIMGSAILFGSLSNLSVVSITLLAAITLYALLLGININLKIVFIILIGLGVFRGIARYIEQYCNHNIAFHLLALFRNYLFKSLRQIGPAILSNKQSGDLITMISTDVEALEVFFAHTISPFFIAIITSSTIFIIFYQVQPILASILLLSQIITGFIVPTISYKYNQKIGDNYKEAFVETSNIIIENMNSLNTISSYTLLTNRKNKLKVANKKLNHYNYLKIKHQATLQSLSEFMVIITAIFIIFIGNYLQIKPLTIFIFSILSLSSFGPIISLTQLGNALLTTLASAKRLYKILQTKATVTFPKNYQEKISNFNELNVINLNYNYEENDTLLKNINFSIKQNQILGIKGPSGSGKSTLLHLLMHYFDVNNGEINFNNTSISKLTKKQLISIEKIMSQETFIFKDTIANNISLNNPHFTLEDIEKAANKAGLTSWINSLDKGFNTIINLSQNELSAGERQRMGLARLFLYDSPIYLLDEPTSHLDYLNELKIMTSLAKEQKNRAIILVSHRDTTLQLAHFILELKKEQ